MGREARKGARVFACRSIEPEQSLGPLTKPVCARMGSDGRDGNWHRCVKGSAGRGGSSNRRESLSSSAQVWGSKISSRGALSPKMVALEATGGFEAVVAAGLAGAGLPVVVVNPAQVRALAQALCKRGKTHLIDAAVIC